MVLPDHFQQKLRHLPDKPGVYQFFDKWEKIIYIGKAKSLKKRVNSYFQKTRHENAKIRILVNNIVSLDYIIVNTESEALLLENNLVKKYKPKYNVQLKDDKTFPWIRVTNGPFPRVFHTREHLQDGSSYYGPYTSMNTVRVILELIRKLYPLRTCNYHLSENNIKAGKFKVCLEYHIGNCKGPCEGFQAQEEYERSIDHIRSILKGNIAEVISYLKSLMKDYADNFCFEDAQVVKEKIDVLSKYQSKSTVVNPSINNVDVFSFVERDKDAFVNYLKLMNGAIVQSRTVEMTKKLDESPEELLAMAIVDIREKVNSRAKDIYLPFDIHHELEDIRVHVPQRGDKKKLVDLSRRNAQYFMLEKDKRLEQSDKKNRGDKILQMVKEDLRMGELPRHIECFDNSNIQGSHPVASCVVFRDGMPSKKEYRKFHVKTVDGPNDYASMEEIVYRRYSRLLDENLDLPQLVIVDGGKGQLSSAVSSLKKLGLYTKITIIGIAKKLEEIYFPGDPVPLYIDKNSPALKLIQRARDEAHRFGLAFHRNKREKSMISSELTSINGIGTKSTEQLISRYKSIEKVKQASLDELSGLIGAKKANILYDYLHPDQNTMQ